MAQTDKFLIAPYASGMQTNLEPWLIPDEAFSFMQNAYVWRGRVRKRFGSYLMNAGVPAGIEQLYSRLRINIGTTNGTTGDLSVTVPGVIFQPGQMFSVQSNISGAPDEIYTVYQTGTSDAMFYTPGIINTTSVSGSASGIVPTASGSITNYFNVGGYIYTVTVLNGALTPAAGAPGSGTFNTATGAYTFTGVSPLAGISFFNGASGTYNTSTGAVVITGSQFLGAAVYFYPATPVTALVRYYDDQLADEPLFAFDQQFAYYWDTSDTPLGWERLGSGAAATWDANDYNLMWTTTYRGANAFGYYLYAVNYNPSDGMRYFDGTNWNDFAPQINSGGDTILTARIVLAYKSRLIILNVVEDNSSTTNTYVNRCRFSAVGNPTATNAWRDDIPGQGTFVDAPTSEAIMSAGFVKDRLIVYFENSTWELIYTGNDADPFRWQKINDELGSESPFSIVPFDKNVLGIDTVGVHSCNGSNVSRIDWKIPDTIFNFQIPNEGLLRVVGVRDYKTEMVYWAWPSFNRNNFYPNRVLAYNYQNQSFALFDDNITALGYFEQQINYTWNQIQRTWEEVEETWNTSRFNSSQLDIVAGNQEGFVFIIDEDCPRNAPALQITNISYSATTNIITFSVINHNLNGGEFLLIENVQGMAGLNGVILEYAIATSSGVNVISCYNPGLTITGTYTGGGTITLVSYLNILSKEFNFYVTEGLDAAVNKVDFQVTNSQTGQVSVEYYASTSQVPLSEQGQSNGCLLGDATLETSPYDPTLYPSELYQERLWHSVYPLAQGEFIQFSIYFTDDQMMNPEVSLAIFELHAMVIYTTPTSRLQ